MSDAPDNNRAREMLANVLLRNAKLPRGAYQRDDGTRFLMGAAFGIDVDRVTVAHIPPFGIEVSIQGAVPESRATVDAFTERYRELFVPAKCTFRIKLA